MVWREDNIFMDYLKCDNSDRPVDLAVFFRGFQSSDSNRNLWSSNSVSTGTHSHFEPVSSMNHVLFPMQLGNTGLCAFLQYISITKYSYVKKGGSHSEAIRGQADCKYTGSIACAQYMNQSETCYRDRSVLQPCLYPPVPNDQTVTWRVQSPSIQAGSPVCKPSWGFQSVVGWALNTQGILGYDTLSDIYQTPGLGPGLRVRVGWENKD